MSCVGGGSRQGRGTRWRLIVGDSDDLGKRGKESESRGEKPGWMVEVLKGVYCRRSIRGAYLLEKGICGLARGVIGGRKNWTGSTAGERGNANEGGR